MGLLHPTQRLAVDNGHGWVLDLRRYHDPDRLDPARRPVVFVPGYAMNSFVLAYHPGGPSMIEHLTQQGFDVWAANLRGQGDSRSTGGSRRFGLGELALEDLPRALARVREETGADAVDAIGCSLGASLVYTYAAHHPADHGLGSMVGIGGPLRWEAVHPAMRLAFTSSRLAGAIPFAGTRTLAKVALPVLKRMPKLLSIYMNAGEIDLSAADQLVNTVEDPVPHINRQVAKWVKRGDLWVRGVNVSEGLGKVQTPLMLIHANADGIVPGPSATSAARAIGTDAVTVLEVGTPARWYAHADLFVGPQAQAEVFEPMGAWLSQARG